MRLKETVITIFFIVVFLGSTLNINAENQYSNTQRANSAVQNDFSEYMSRLQEKLRANWQPPDFMEEGHVRVFFKLNRQGQVISASVIESSGNDIYDESAIEALKNCAPFGSFPEETLREFISVKYSFDTILIEEERMNGYYERAKLNAKNNPRMALEYLNLAINKVGGEEASCFLYKRRALIKEALGDTKGAREDYDIYNLYTNRANIKRVHLLKHLAETKPSSYIYHYLAYAYEQVGDYNNAIDAINKAIALTCDNGNLKYYRDSLMQKRLTG